MRNLGDESADPRRRSRSCRRRVGWPSLRPYQRDAVEAVLAARRAGVRRMVVCLPTGAGKTVIFSQLARMAKRTVLVLAHREELLSQAREKIEGALGGDSVVAIEQGGRRAPQGARVIVCSIRSLHAGRLLDRSRIQYAWPLAQERRQHIHGVIDEHRLPVTHTTVRRGRPYTLVLTKQKALFEREAALRARQKTLLAWLKKQRSAFGDGPNVARTPGR